ncbi:DNA cytosine methyltransferase [Brevundimonas subvibrioides]|uniref:DNA (cytosine-5-)-methyltransferase n=1 Tax=Brevundimonas subvibrioides (strain ATCC 15264 / DSM 4735 / LMG 14903 / NBRC 16000 / CB 81) TaxID=633149 RepID=D9QIL0_BRESC|nr:DNA cytosine methyltransferase [Brevundimonas subvibrioides]ADL01343.1 DNA-cytosine methyltransferase [Brevundimonas subvibrioides ATCC 15264]
MRSVELFAGAGGLGIGVARAGFEPAAVVEWDRWACETLLENKPWPVHRGDVREFSYDHLANIELVSGGPPCQPFSMGGKHNAFLDRRDMFPEAIRAVRELQPKAFIFENVKGLTRQAFANYLEYIRLQLRHPEMEARAGEPWLDHLARLERHETSGSHAGLHYNVVLRLLNAANHGVPQKRERVFIVGFRSDLSTEWNFPAETHSARALAWAQGPEGDYWDQHKVARNNRPLLVVPPKERPESQPWLTVRDALVGLPDPQTRPEAAKAFPDHRFIPGARSYPGHTGSPLDQPSKTLKAGVHGVPGGENMLRRPDGSVRYFSVRESARLQTFPDDFLFHGAWGETMRQLGNAVPVRLAEIVAQSVRAQLDGVEARGSV